MSDLEKARKYLKFGKIVQAEGLLLSALESAKAEKDIGQQETILDLMIGHLYAPSEEYPVARDYLDQLRALNGDQALLEKNEALVASIRTPDQKQSPNFDNQDFLALMKLIEDEKTFVQGGETGGFFAIADIRQALEVSRRQDLQDFEIWPSLRSKESSKVLAKHQKENLDLSGFEENWAEAISGKIQKIYWSSRCSKFDILDDLIGDITMLSEYKIADLQDSPLFEDMIAAYRAGLWPCGWHGDYPDGSLAVFDFRNA